MGYSLNDASSDNATVWTLCTIFLTIILRCCPYRPPAVETDPATPLIQAIRWKTKSIMVMMRMRKKNRKKSETSMAMTKTGQSVCQSTKSQCNRRSKIGRHRQFPHISPDRSCSGSNAVKQVGWRLFQSRICSKTSQELELFDSTALPSLCENRSLAELIWSSTT